MKILFVTLEQSARENLKVLLNNHYFLSNKDKFYTFGMSDEFLSFKDLTNIKIKSLITNSEHISVDVPEDINKILKKINENNTKFGQMNNE